MISLHIIKRYLLSLACLALLTQRGFAAEPSERQAVAFVAEHCASCHGGADPEAGISLDLQGRDWKSEATQQQMERALRAVTSRDMPPKDELQPAEIARSRFAEWLDRQLVAHSRTDGALVRRLNRVEYRNTIRSLLGLQYELPEGFPSDSEAMEFDTLAEDLVLSPPLMEAYVNTAAEIADTLFPPERPLPPAARQEIAAEELVISYSSGSLRNGAMRLASKCSPIMRSSTWPSKIEIKSSGVYRLTVTAACFGCLPENEPMRLELRARDVSSSDGVNVDSLRLLAAFDVDGESPQSFEVDVALYQGQTVVFHFANAPLDSDKEDKTSLRRVFEEKFAADPRYLAAWLKMTGNDARGGFRGGLGWQRVKKLMASDDIDLEQTQLDSPATLALLERIEGNSVLFVETIAYDFYENGPALEIHSAAVAGPITVVESPEDQAIRKLQDRLLGDQGQRSRDQWLEDIASSLLSRAFRGPVEESTVAAFTRLVRQHEDAGHSWQQSLHLLLRATLMSPRFLYRELSPGSLDDFDLASRLAYFLTSAPPDEQLLQLAQDGSLSDPHVLRSQARRLLPLQPDATFITQFTSQWLDVELLDDLMPDARLKINAEEQQQARQEVEHFFAAMIRENRPMRDFIDPDFTYTSAGLASKVYELKSGFDAKQKGIQRVALEKGGRYGGILGQAGVLMATANGVDTQPVIRGVWVLENVLGSPPPPPPQAVPAITPDTSGTTTPRELLAAHASHDSCAVCHRKIDPIGFALESFDAVGRWREHYAVWTVNEKGKPISMPGAAIDTRGMLPDGTAIGGVIDLKRWIVAHIDQFSECISEKLMTYATGRRLNFAQRKEIAQLVADNHQANGGFQDLMLSLIDSQTFRSK